MPSVDKHLERRAHRRSLRRAGKSVEGRPIEVFSFLARSARARTAVILGAVHGDEPKTAFVCRRLIELLGEGVAPSHVSWVVVPVVNPDGYAGRRRRNANRVDINRNFPTKNWTVGKRRSRMFGGDVPASEPETRAVIRIIERYRPAWIVTVHSIGRNRFCNNYDGPARSLAAKMAKRNGYPVRASIGYPTPGSFGTWAGVERRIPTITLELPSHHSATRCWNDNRDALLITL